MTKLKQLLSYVTDRHLESLTNQREAQKTFNPHLLNKYSAQAGAYLDVIQKITTLLEKKNASISKKGS